MKYWEKKKKTWLEQELQARGCLPGTGCFYERLFVSLLVGAALPLLTYRHHSKEITMEGRVWGGRRTYS